MHAPFSITPLPLNGIPLQRMVTKHRQPAEQLAPLHRLHPPPVPKLPVCLLHGSRRQRTSMDVRRGCGMCRFNPLHPTCIWPGRSISLALCDLIPVAITPAVDCLALLEDGLFASSICISIFLSPVSSHAPSCLARHCVAFSRSTTRPAAATLAHSATRTCFPLLVLLC